MDALLSDDQLHQYDEEGYLILRGLLPREEIARILDRVDGMLEGRYDGAGCKVGPASAASDRDPGRLIKFVMPMEFPIRDPVLRASADHPLLKSLVSRLLRAKDVVLFQQQALVKEPGAVNATPWHQDEHYWRLGDRRGCTAWMPLVPATRANGTMHLLPRSHKGRLVPHESAGGGSIFQKLAEPIDEAKLVPLELEPGDVSFHDKGLIHGAYSNAGTTRRVAFAQHYAEKR